MELSLEDLESERCAAAPRDRPCRRSRRQARAAALARAICRASTIVHEPRPCTCPECGGELRALGEDVSEMLEYVPEHCKVIRHVRPKLSCAGCQQIVQARRPAARSSAACAGPGLLAHVLVSKYCDHLPLYRQSQIYAREGIELDRSTLADWVGGGECIARSRWWRRSGATCSRPTSSMPTIPRCRCCAPGAGKTKQGRLWTYVRDDRPAGSTEPPAVFFRYSPDRKGERPRAHLKRLHRRAAGGRLCRLYRPLRRAEQQEAACWAHVRRKFYDIHAAHALADRRRGA